MKDYINSLYDLFASWAEEQGEAPAFITPEGFVSYAEFLNRVDHLAAGLHIQGLSKGDRVATVAKNSVAHLAVLVASTRLGAIAFPVNWRLASQELKQAIDLSGPTAIFIEEEFYPLFSEIEINQIQIRGLLGEQEIPEFIPVANLEARTKPPAVDIHQEDPAVIIATAAVAGVPRGAVLTHGNLISVSRMFANAYQLSSVDRFLGVLPFFHIAGIEYLFVMAMVGGASVILPGFDAELGHQMMEEHRVSLITTFPPMLEKLIEAREKSGGRWPNMRACWGILNPPEVIQKYLALDSGEYWTGYGQTETTGIATLGIYREKPSSAGKVVDGLELRIVNDLDEDVSPGEVGEIAVKGNLVFSHYWQDEEASAYAARAGWHHTGDLGRVDEDGFMFYAGRKPEKELIKSGGENIYPAEVETAIRKLAEVEDVCVIGVPDDKWGETVKAVVVLRAGQKLDEKQLLSGISDHLAAYKKPRLIEFVPQLPRDAHGKVDRLKVKADFGK